MPASAAPAPESSACQAAERGSAWFGACRRASAEEPSLCALGGSRRTDGRADMWVEDFAEAGVDMRVDIGADTEEAEVRTCLAVEIVCRHDMSADICADKCEDTCANMCLDVCVDVCVVVCVDVGADMCADACADVCADVCAAVCADVCVKTRVQTCMQPCAQTCA